VGSNTTWDMDGSQACFSVSLSLFFYTEVFCIYRSPSQHLFFCNLVVIFIFCSMVILIRASVIRSNIFMSYNLI
jgi:hypothetical protein